MSRTLPYGRAKSSRLRKRIALCAVLFAGSSGLVGATVFGDDERLGSESMLTAREVALYSATQMIFCKAPGSESHAATGTLAMDFMHGVSVAHAFYDRKLKRLHTPAECGLGVYDGAGKPLQLIAITRIRTMWDDQPPRDGTDLAMFELADRSKYIDTYATLPKVSTPVYEGESVFVVAFHIDLKPAHTKRKTHGTVFSTFGTMDAGVLNIFHTDADWANWASGGPIYNSNGGLVALVKGNSSAAGNTAALRFDPRTTFNRAIRPDTRFLRAYAEFVEGR